MSKFAQSYITTATEIVTSFNGAEPFHLFLKKYFAAQKKCGSRDRKEIAQLCYCYYRLGHALTNFTVEQRILHGLFLCATSSNEVLHQLKPEWNDKVELPLERKISLLDAPISLENIFPYKTELSSHIEREEFNYSFLIQPDLFLRIRPGYKEAVTAKLDGAGVTYKFIDDNCIVLPNASKVDSIIQLDKEALVQDYSSQQTIAFLKSAIVNPNPPFNKLTVWDCCAGSGGKSILAHDTLMNIQLTVSDVRENILRNLHNRFKRAGIKNYHSFVADLTNSKFEILNSQFEIIIIDAPCTGSGTWNRTPEQLNFFDPLKIEHYSSLQKRIAINAVKALNQNGLLLYITCSVFTKENEEVVKFMQKNTGLQLRIMQYFKGYTHKADTLFAALFQLS